MRCKIFFLFSFFLFFSCEVKKEITPKYLFKIGEEQACKLNGNANLSVDMGLFSTESKITFKAEVKFNPSETNKYGYKIKMDINNPEIDGVSEQLRAAFLIGVNYIRRVLGEFHIDEYGRSKVFINNTEIFYLSYFVGLLFTDLTYINTPKSFSTNIIGWINNFPTVTKYNEQQYVKEKSFSSILIYQKGELTTYEKEEFEKSIEPRKMGEASYEIQNQFNPLEGKIPDKKATFSIEYDIPVKQGFITTYIKIKCKGELTLIKGDKQI